MNNFRILPIVIFLLFGVQGKAPEPQLECLLNEKMLSKPAQESMRTAAIFETSHEKHNWLNKINTFAGGTRLADEVIIRFHHVN